MKRALLIQPARLGDLFICLPIAKHYSDKGFDVFWPVMQEFLSTFDNIDYVTPIPLGAEFGIGNCVPGAYACDDGTYDKVIDLSFGFPGSKVAFWEHNTMMASNFVDAKYKIAKMNIHLKHGISFNRNTEKEDSLYSALVSNDRYVVVHNSTSSGDGFLFEPEESADHQVIDVRPVEGYNLFDWYKVIRGAQKVYCVNSSFFNLLEGIDDFRDINKVYLNTRNAEGSWNERKLMNNWRTA